MLSVSTPMSVGRATQYFKADDYYLTEKGEWQGRGALALGLSGEVLRGDFQAVLTGRHPESGEALIERGGSDSKNIRGGIDLTFSAPKGVSVLSLADSSIKEAHRQAVSTVLSYLENHYSHARLQEDGERFVTEHGNLAVAKFTHMVSRASDGDILPDPQLHTHAFVVNLIRTSENEWKAHHNDAIYRDQLRLGRFYRAELASNLRELGYAIEVTDAKKYLWDVKGVPESVREEFSKRRHQIEERAEELRKSGEFAGANDAELREMANKQTRLPKGKVSPQELLDCWKTSLLEQGHSLDELHETARREGSLELNKPKQKETPEAILRLATELKTSSESVFDKGEVLDLAVRLSPPGNLRVGDLEAAFSTMVSRGDIPSLGKIHELDKRGTPTPREIFTTREMQKIEREILEMVRASKGRFSPIASEVEIDFFAAGKELQTGWEYTSGQLELARVALTSSDRINIIQGDAGSGKTAGLSLVREFAESCGVQVAGLGFTGKAADELKKGAAIESATLDSFLRSNSKDSLPAGSILVLDEASMAGSRHFHALLKFAEDKDHKVVIVGDRKQFQAISAGRNHAVLQDLADVEQVRMDQVLRQETALAKEVVSAIADGQTDQALAKLSRDGSLKQIADREKRLAEVVGEYLHFRNEKKDVLVLSATNADRVELNDRIRRELVSKGQLKGGKSFKVKEPTSLGAEEAARAGNYKVGQRLLVLNDLSSRVKGGAEGDIVSIDQRRNSVTIEIEKQNHEIRLKKHYSDIAVYSQTERNFAPGDRIVFLRNDKKLNVKNGLQGTIERLDKKGNITVAADQGERFRFRLSDEAKRKSLWPINPIRHRYNFITHAYAITDHKSQGATTQVVIWYADASKGRINRNSFYVAATRAKETIKIFTNDKEELKQQVRRPQSKSSTLDYLRDIRDRFDGGIPDRTTWREELLPKQEASLRKPAAISSRDISKDAPVLEREREKERQIERTR